jgi:hypothetical protein
MHWTRVQAAAAVGHVADSFLREIHMRVPLHRLAGIAAAALLVASADTARAQGKGHGKEHKSTRAEARVDDRHRDDRRVYDSHGDYDPRGDRARKRVPPGLAKKPGGMPPGQYKKLYSADQGAYVLSDVLGRRGYPIVRRADAGTSEYVYYRDHDGRIRRAIVSPGDGRLRFSNVPSSLLTEVLARLY